MSQKGHSPDMNPGLSHSAQSVFLCLVLCVSLWVSVAPDKGWVAELRALCTGLCIVGLTSALSSFPQLPSLFPREPPVLPPSASQASAAHLGEYFPH